MLALAASAAEALVLFSGGSKGSTAAAFAAKSSV